MCASFPTRRAPLAASSCSSEAWPWHFSPPAASPCDGRLTQFRALRYSLNSSNTSCGAVAQLGERVTGSHEVRSSILLGSIENFRFTQHQINTPALLAL